MFEKSKLIEVLETPELIETPKLIKIKKPRKPMSEERKEALREQLKKAREIKAAKKIEKSAPLPIIKEEIVLDVGGHSVPKEVKVKKIRKRKEPVTTPDDSMELRRQLDELRTANKNRERELLKQQIANQELKKAHFAKKEEIVEEKEEVVRPPSPVHPEKRYSTYKKSVWAEYGI